MRMALSSTDTVFAGDQKQGILLYRRDMSKINMAKIAEIERLFVAAYQEVYFIKKLKRTNYAKVQV